MLFLKLQVRFILFYGLLFGNLRYRDYFFISIGISLRMILILFQEYLLVVYFLIIVMFDIGVLIMCDHFKAKIFCKAFM
jgi:hypothetical protein